MKNNTQLKTMKDLKNYENELLMATACQQLRKMIQVLLTPESFKIAYNIEPDQYYLEKVKVQLSNYSDEELMNRYLDQEDFHYKVQTQTIDSRIMALTDIPWFTYISEYNNDHPSDWNKDCDNPF